MIGMEIMLKSLGIDSEAIKGQAGQIGLMLKQFNEALARIEQKVDRLETRLSEVIGYDPTPDETDILPRPVLLTPDMAHHHE